MIESLRRLVVRSFASIAKPTVAPTRHTAPWTAIAMTRMVSTLWAAAAGKPSESKKPSKKFGGNKSMAFMQTMFEDYVKAKKAGKSKKCKKHDYDSSSSSDSE